MDAFYASRKDASPSRYRHQKQKQEVLLAQFIHRQGEGAGIKRAVSYSQVQVL